MAVIQACGVLPLHCARGVKRSAVRSHFEMKEAKKGTRLVQRLSHIMYLSISFKKSTPPQNRKLNVLISNRKKISWRFCGGVDFLKLIDVGKYILWDKRGHPEFREESLFLDGSLHLCFWTVSWEKELIYQSGILRREVPRMQGTQHHVQDHARAADTEDSN